MLFVLFVFVVRCRTSPHIPLGLSYLQRILLLFLTTPTDISEIESEVFHYGNTTKHEPTVCAVYIYHREINA